VNRVLWIAPLCCIAWLLGNGLVAADERLPQTHCLTSMVGQIICPPPNGSITSDARGVALCGYGECLQDARGQWICSREPGGHVGRTAVGQVACTGGCDAASPALCEVAKP
jgi:hypothetical protein